MRSYTLGEAAALIQVTEKTLRVWFIKARHNLEQYTSPIDGRGYAIPAETIRQIARLHKRDMLNQPSKRTTHHADPEKVALRAEIQTLREELTALRAGQSFAPARRAAPLHPGVTSHTPITRSRPDEEGKAPYLPDGWAPLATYARTLGWSDTGIKSAIKSGRVAAHEGRWKWGPSGKYTTNYALDPEQQAALPSPDERMQHKG